MMFVVHSVEHNMKTLKFKMCVRASNYDEHRESIEYITTENMVIR